MLFRQFHIRKVVTVLETTIRKFVTPVVRYEYLRRKKCEEKRFFDIAITRDEDKINCE